ncbi:MAG: oxygenase MpaB family protein [Acidimicrobiia bacterium]
MGFQRAVVVEELDPFLVASVHATQKIVSQARTRYDRTICYFATVAFADSASLVQASERLVKLHAPVGSRWPGGARQHGVWHPPRVGAGRCGPARRPSPLS